MTWSIVARDEGGALGVAVASAVSVKPCAHGRARVGALASQGLVNPTYGPRALEMLAQGQDPKEVIARLTADDPGRDERQLQIVDAQGRTAAHTGSACVESAGHIARDSYSVAGNYLYSDRVLKAVASSYAHAKGPFAERLLFALAAGDEAGGDKRGARSAALLVLRDRSAPLDLLVEGEPEPVAQLIYHYTLSTAGMSHGSSGRAREHSE